jgi:hypothetical protein
MKEHGKDSVEYSLSITDLFTVISFLQLALRHPLASSGPGAVRLRGLLTIFREALTNIDPVLGEIIDAGNNPQFDQVLTPPPLPFQIQALWAYIGRDADGTEGVLGTTLPSGAMIPLIGADEARIKSYRPFAIKVARASAKRIFLAHFSQRTDLEEIQ